MITNHVCTNGVRIIHERMPHVRSVALGIWIKAGSEDESATEAGIAHFIEHMLFKGTAKRTARTIAEEFDRIGGDLNAFTSKDMTCLYATVLSEHAANAIAILEDMLFHSTFEEVEIEKEKSVVLEEISTVEDMPDDDVHEQLWTTMYPNDPVGKPILGNKESVMTFTKEKMIHFMDRLYRPENMVISIAGNCDDHLISYIDELFGSFESKDSLQLEDVAETPVFYPGVLVKEKRVEQTHLCLGYPGLAISDDRMYDLVILDGIIGAAMSSRLFQEVREERGLAYSIYSYFTAYKDTGSFIIYGGTSPDKTNELYSTIKSITDGLVTDGVTEREMDNVKEQVIGGFLLGLESTESRMFRNGKNELMQEGHRSTDEVVAKIRLVEKANVNKLAETILTKQSAISVIAPKSAVNKINFL